MRPQFLEQRGVLRSLLPRARQCTSGFFFMISTRRLEFKKLTERPFSADIRPGPNAVRGHFLGFQAKFGRNAPPAQNFSVRERLSISIQRVTVVWTLRIVRILFRTVIAVCQPLLNLRN